MKNRTLFFALSLIGLGTVAPALSGCQLATRAYNKVFGSDAKEAYNLYQVAVAEGNLPIERVALMRLVKAQEEVPDYWMELGKVDIQLGDYSRAYDAFMRAHELDRSNVQALVALTQLALISGQLPLADEHARTLSLLDPNNPAVILVNGYMALSAGNFDKADAAADKLLATQPNDPSSNILKARVLIDRQKIDDAIALLEKQHLAAPDDRQSLRALTSIYRSRDDWRNVARVQGALVRLDPKDPKNAEKFVEALLRAGDIADAGSASAPLLSNAAPPEVSEATLLLWARFAPKAIVPNVAALANSVVGDKRAIFADYFNRIGKPSAAARLLGSPKPISPANSRWNAVLAQAMALQGQLAPARQLFDQVLEREPDQVDALRGRSALEARTGMAKQAVIDAQRLVSVTPDTGEDRLLLAEAYAAAGSKGDVGRTLWEAFQDLPDDERVRAALRVMLASSGDADGQRRLDEEYADRKMTRLTKELV